MPSTPSPKALSSFVESCPQAARKARRSSSRPPMFLLDSGVVSRPPARDHALSSLLVLAQLLSPFMDFFRSRIELRVLDPKVAGATAPPAAPPCRTRTQSSTPPAPSTQSCPPAHRRGLSRAQEPPELPSPSTPEEHRPPLQLRQRIAVITDPSLAVSSTTEPALTRHV